MVYKPLVDGVVDFDKIDNSSAGFSILKDRTHIKYGLAGLVGAHESGNWKLTPTMGARVVREGNTFTVTEFVSQRPTKSSPGFNWEAGKSAEEVNAMKDWKVHGLKPLYEEIKKDIDVLIPIDADGEVVRASIIRSEADLISYCNTDLIKKTVLQPFMTFPNVTSDTYDSYIIPTFTTGKIESSFNVGNLSVIEKTESMTSTGVKEAGQITINGRAEIEYLPDAKIERLIAPLRQSKAMWNFIEDLFGISLNYAPLDMVFLWNQFEAAKDFGKFVFDQIVSFDQKPFSAGLDLKSYIAMQLVRLMAFKTVKDRCPITAWARDIKVRIRHPMISDKEFEDSMAYYDKFWNNGTFERIPVAGEGTFDLKILPIGNSTIVPNGFKTASPLINFTQIKSPMMPEYKEELQSFDFTKTPRLVASDVPGKIISFNRLFGIDGITDEKYSAVMINVITPSTVKKIVPHISANAGYLDRFDEELWPILIQQMSGDIDPEGKFTSNKLNDVGKYALGLVPFTKGPLFAWDPNTVKTKDDKIGYTYKEYDEDSKKLLTKTGDETRYSVYPTESDAE